MEVKQGKNSTLGFKNCRLNIRASVERSVMRVSQLLAPDKDFMDLIEGRESKITLLEDFGAFGFGRLRGSFDLYLSSLLEADFKLG